MDRNKISSQIKKYSCIYSNETIALFSSLDILRSAYAVSSVCPFDSEKSAHSHAFYELHSVLEGEILYYVGEKEIHLHAGEYIIFPKKCLHLCASFAPHTSRFIIAFDTSLGVSDFLIAEPKVKSLTPRGIERIHMLLAEDNHIDTLDQYARVVSVALPLILDYTEKNLSFQSDYISNEYIRAISRYLRENRHRIVTISEILEHCHCNHRNINHILKREMNTNISNLVNRHKADLIADYLQNTDMSLAEIAELTGFSTEYSMSRFFIREFKTTPGRFRKVSIGYQKV